MSSAGRAPPRACLGAEIREPWHPSAPRRSCCPLQRGPCVGVQLCSLPTGGLGPRRRTYRVGRALEVLASDGDVSPMPVHLDAGKVALGGACDLAARNQTHALPGWTNLGVGLTVGQYSESPGLEPAGAREAIVEIIGGRLSSSDRTSPTPASPSSLARRSACSYVPHVVGSSRLRIPAFDVRVHRRLGWLVAAAIFVRPRHPLRKPLQLVERRNIGQAGKLLGLLRSLRLSHSVQLHNRRRRAAHCTAAMLSIPSIWSREMKARAISRQMNSHCCSESIPGTSVGRMKNTHMRNPGLICRMAV